jgi:glutamate racemase
MIGVLDSGLGGLTFLKEFSEALPNYSFVYLGDNARSPYGNKSQETIYKYTRQGVEFLFSKGCHLVIIACNTASTEALRKIQQELLPQKYPGKNVLGVVVPIAEGAMQTINYDKKKNKIGIIGTRATIESASYDQELKKLSPGVEIYKKATPLLVPLIEEGWLKRRETKMILRYYLRDLKVSKINTLILGCTHYPVLQDTIQKIMGSNITVLDTPKVVSLRLHDYLSRHQEHDKQIKKKGERIFYTTDDKKRFATIGERFYQEPIKEVKRIELE